MKSIRRSLFCLVATMGSSFTVNFAFALNDAQSPCSPDTAVGSSCEAQIKDLRPSQFSFGKLEVEIKAHKLSKMSKSKFDSYKHSHPATLVIGPSKTLYIVDGHHITAVLLSLGEKSVSANISEDLSHLNNQDFESQMLAHHWAWLLDENGQSGKTFSQLPKSVAELKDNPYRSLAWMVRKAGGYADSTELWADFLWSEFFRGKLKIKASDEDLSEATKTALDFAHSPDASHLPGYTPEF
jgi:hypothetical protein